jgi:hypothetical protein
VRTLLVISLLAILVTIQGVKESPHSTPYLYNSTLIILNYLNCSNKNVRKSIIHIYAVNEPYGCYFKLRIGDDKWQLALIRCHPISLLVDIMKEL